MSDSTTDINISVTLTESNGAYSWGYTCETSGINMNSAGTIDLLTSNVTTPVSITYTLASSTYQLIYVNLGSSCATRQIQSLTVDPTANSVTIYDLNSTGSTENTAFSLLLVARANGDVSGGLIVSPDPQVENDPPDSTP